MSSRAFIAKIITYKKIAYTFLALTLVVVLLVANYLLIAAEIIIEPKKFNLEDSGEINIKQPLTDSIKENNLSNEVIPSLSNFNSQFTNLNNQTLNGIFLTTELTDSQQYSVRQTQNVPDYAQGEIIIINNYSRSQTLVATTRLLSPNNILYRLQHRVVVPAGGRMKALIKADQKGPQGNILTPTRFTIPGLWDPLEAYIYAETSGSITGGLRKIGILSETEIEEAKADFQEKLKKQAEEKLKAMLTEIPEAKLNFDSFLFQHDVSNLVSDKTAGQETDTYTINGSIKSILVGYAGNDLLNILNQKILSNLPPHRQLNHFNKTKLKLTITAINPERQEARVAWSLNIPTKINPQAEDWQRVRFINLTPSEVKEKLLQWQDIKNVQIHLRPFWLKKLPTAADRIEIIIKE